MKTQKNCSSYFRNHLQRVLLLLTMLVPVLARAQNPITILMEPVSQTSVVSGGAYFSVMAMGDLPLSFQWQRNGTNIYGRSVSSYQTSSYFIDDVTFGDAGSYSVIVSGQFSSATSSVATLTVVVAPSIVKQPLGCVTNAGSKVVLWVAAEGSPQITYQWRKNGVDIPGATLGSLVMGNVQRGDSGSYSVYVSNAGGGVGSAAAEVVVCVPPAITVQPSSVSAVTGRSVDFAVGASGFPLAYQWYNNYGEMAGATNSTIHFTDVSASLAGDYWVVVGNYLAKITSAVARLTVSEPDLPVILEQPHGATAQAGTTITLSALVSGAAASYQWYKDGVKLPYQNYNSLVIYEAQWTNSGGYYLVATNVFGAATSSVADVFIISPPVITAAPQSRTASAGSTVSLSVTATGMLPIDYQWRKNGQDIPGAIYSSYTLSGVQAADSGTYSVYLSNPAGSVTSGGAVVNVGGVAPSIVTFLTGYRYAPARGSAQFSVVASGSPLFYQWRKSGTPIVGATTSVLALSNLTTFDTAGYSVTVSNYLGYTTSGTMSLTVGDPPVITAQPQGRTAQAGSNFSLTVSATGSPIFYYWLKNGVQLYGSSSSYYISSATWSNTGLYSVIVSNYYGTVTSSVAEVFIIAPPVISAQPQSRTASVGATVTLAVGATGMLPIDYQWRKNGSDIPEAIYSSYTLSSIQLADSGTYSVYLSNPAGSLVSSGAVVNCGGTVPSIVTHPAGPVYAQVGGIVNFSVIATGAPLYYQWRKSGYPISGATASSLSLSNVVGLDSASYSVTVSNYLGNLTSSSAVLSVGVAPSIVTHPVGRTAQAGSNFTMTVSATASNSPVNYQWRKDGVPLSQAISSNYSINNAQWTNTGSYTVVASNLFGMATSSVAEVFIIAPPVITTQPLGRNTNVGAAVLFSPVVAGMMPLNYQWRKNGYDIPGATLGSFGMGNVQISDSGSYSVFVSNPAGSTLSTNAVLNVGIAPLITMHPQSVTASNGQSVVFGVTATGQPLSYQWRKNGQAISGATDSIFSIGGVAFADAGTYSVVVSNFVRVSTSSGAVLTVLDSPPLILAQPVGQTLEAGEPFVVDVSAMGAEPLAYQWRRDGAVVPGATASSHAVSIAALGDSGDYDVVITNAFGAITSAVANINVFCYKPGISAQPVGGTILTGTNFSFGVLANGTLPLVYQWRKDGADIAGATGSTWVITNAATTDSGTYSVVITNMGGSITSSPAVLVVGAPVVITIHPRSITNAPGDPAQFETSVEGTTPISLQWFKDGNPLVGETNLWLTCSNAQPKHIGYYHLRAVNQFGSAVSSNAAMSIVGVQFDLWQGLVAFYPFDGNAADGSVYRNDGVVTSATLAADRRGVGGSAYFFDGLSSFIECANQPQINFGMSNFTMSAWVRTAGFDSNAWVVGKSSSGIADGYWIGSTDGSNSCASLGNESYLVSAAGTNGINDEAWHQLTVVCDRASTLRLFMDGVLCAETNIASMGGRITNAAPLLIGKSRSGAGFVGIIDEVRLFNRALSDVQLQALFEADSPAPVINTGAAGFGVNSGHFEFNVNSGGGQTMVIETSTNLIDWTPIQTNASEGGITRFSDPGVSTNAARFFRARRW